MTISEISNRHRARCPHQGDKLTTKRGDVFEVRASDGMGRISVLKNGRLITLTTYAWGKILEAGADLVMVEGVGV